MDPVQKAIWFVESHLRSAVSLEEIAAACKVSPYHLTRAFAASAGMSLMRYVRGRRLSEAARALRGGASDILAVALDAGYGSHEAFTRAFREQFGLTPEQVRGQGQLAHLTLVEPLAMNAPPIADVTPDRIETRPPTLYAGLVQRHPCQSPQGIPAQWQRLGPYLGHIPGQQGDAAYGVVYNFDSESNFDYLCGVQVRSAEGLPPGFQTLEVQAQKYVVFRHTAHIAGIRSTLSAIWNKWLPESGHRAAEAPTLERYGPEFNPTTGLGGCEIWIAVEG